MRRIFQFPWRTAAQVAADVDEELQFHLEMVARELIDDGWPEDAARMEAVRRFGDVETTRKVCRQLDAHKEKQMKWMKALEEIGQDLRYAFRQLAKSPGFTLIAILTLALGVGATTSIFSVVDGVLLRPLPFPDPDRLVRVYPLTEKGEPNAISVLNFLDWRKQSRTIEAASLLNSGSVNLTGTGGEPERLSGAWVSPEFFSVLKAPLLSGRGFAKGEDQPKAPNVVVLSSELWQRRFGGDRGLVGRTINLDGEPYTVIGIAGRNRWPSIADLWLPFELSENALDPDNRGAIYLSVVARLAPGVSLEKARAETSSIAAALAAEYPKANTGYRMDIVGMQTYMTGDVRVPLLVLMGAVLLVLLIACVNVANLLLVRASGREAELAVRTALGAGRLRIIRQLLTESVVLSLLGGAAGVALAVWATRALVALAPERTPRLAEVGVDGPVLFFTLGVSLLTGLLFGLAPALKASRPDLGSVLKEGARGGKGRAATAARSALVVLETALAVLLLAGAGLLLRSFGALIDVNPGFDPEGAIVFNLAPPESKYAEDPQLRQLASSLIERMDKLPGVTAAGGAAFGRPLDDSGFVLSFDVEGRPEALPGEEPAMRVALVTPGYFKALGLPLKRGRAFTDQDREGSTPVAILTEEAVRQFFPNEEPLGRRILLGWVSDGVRRSGEVVGVVGDFKQSTLDTKADPQIFLPFDQSPLGSLSVIVRSTADLGTVAAAARAQVREVDPDLPLYELQTLDEVVSASVSEPRFYMLLLGGFAAVALILAAIGMYGVIAYGVSQRSREIGVRMALGASRDRVVRMVVKQALVLAVFGAVFGLGLALVATRGMKSLLFGVSAIDPGIYVAVAAVLVLVAGLASYLPARRASRTDPQLALRGEV
ncbi:MAG TPA: ABC transporter permease [Thermoanaerobaculia bacterium]|jgi:predicted permease|nr:ABC transporter permease [Thermoanaerobaculia bacterium]